MRVKLLATCALTVASLFILLVAVVAERPNMPDELKRHDDTELGNRTNADTHFDKATFGSGCFWCTEGIFQQLKGVRSVVSGYSGGNVANPTYDEVCSGTTGHAEVVQLTYDPKVISYSELLHVFWSTHDPTTLNRQGNDVGTQYRSVIFYHDADQRALAEKYKQQLDASGSFKRAIVTEIQPFSKFYAAEDYHQNYYAQNRRQPYCRFVVRPKIEKFQRQFADKVKAR